MIQKECTKFITIDESLLKNFKKFTEQDHECIVNYLFSGKGVILYEMITTFDLLNISPREGEFFFCLIIFILILKTILFHKKNMKMLRNFGE